MSKIPTKLRNADKIASGHFVVWASGIVEAGPVFMALNKKKTVPCFGQIQVKGKKFHYCRYGFVDDDLIYTSN